jgi:hypothetical protein
MRGDLPVDVETIRRVVMATPHARGSTLGTGSQSAVTRLTATDSVTTLFRKVGGGFQWALSLRPTI